LATVFYAEERLRLEDVSTLRATQRFASNIPGSIAVNLNPAPAEMPESTPATDTKASVVVASSCSCSHVAAFHGR
jgi:hypothetical protein